MASVETTSTACGTGAGAGTGGHGKAGAPYNTTLVRAADGRAWCAAHVVSTLPLGVMQRDHARVFTRPPLARATADGLAAFTSGNFTKIFAQFEERFWAGRGTQWLIANAPDDDDEDGGSGPRRRGPMEFHDLSALVHGSNTLFTYVTGDDSARWEQMTDARASAALTRRLRAHFPGAAQKGAVRAPTAFYMTRHGADPYMRGAYSVGEVGFGGANFSAILAPHAGGRVFFAGEHTCAAFQGYVHGGLYSGRRGAAEVLRALGRRGAAARAYGGACERCARPGMLLLGGGGWDPAAAE